MGKITSKEEYYAALALTKEVEDEVIQTFALAKKLGADLKLIEEFDIMSARELARQFLNLIGENYPAINNISQYQDLNSPKSQEDMNVLKIQLEIREMFANK